MKKIQTLSHPKYFWNSLFKADKYLKYIPSTQYKTTMNKEIRKRIDEKWSEHASTIGDSELKTRWWQSPFIIQQINKIVNGKEVDGRSQGLIELTKDKFEKLLPFKKGISVGCGTGKKEMNLILQNVVESFDLYELSEGMIEKGKELAKELGVLDRVNFVQQDVFEVVMKKGQYDFVHWGDSLHHMLDVDEAVKWSKKVLKKGGLFFMDDFVGAARFQWSDKSLEIGSKVREVFQDTKYLVNPYSRDTLLPTKLHRPDIHKMIQSDPSEAVDSNNIIKAINKYFPNAEIKCTGGLIYHLVLSDMLNNIDEGKTEDQILIKLLMVIDELTAEIGETQYAVALAIK